MDLIDHLMKEAWQQENKRQDMDPSAKGLPLFTLVTCLGNIPSPRIEDGPWHASRKKPANTTSALTS